MLNYRFSKLHSIINNNDNITINAYSTGSNIDLFEDKYVNEFKVLMNNKGTNEIKSELENLLYEHNVLVDNNFIETKFLESIFQENEKKIVWSYYFSNRTV